MSTTALGTLAVIVGVAVLVWDARRSAGPVRSPTDDVRAAAAHTAIAVLVGALGSELIRRNWSERAYWIALLVLLGIIVVFQLVRRISETTRYRAPID